MFLPISLTAETAKSIVEANPKIPVINCSGFSSDNFLSALDKINIEVENAIKNAEIFMPPPPRTSNFSIRINAPTSSAIATVSPPNPTARRFPSIDDNSNNDPARMAIAPAILSNVLAFKSRWYDANASFTEFNVSEIFVVIQITNR